MFGDVSAGGNYPIDKPGGDWKSLVMEIVLTTILVSIILHTATGHRSIGHNAAIAVGSTVALLGLFASPISGASMNPARSLGPDIVGNNYTGWWVYIAGPVIGAAIAVVIITAVRGMPDKQGGKRPRAAHCRLTVARALGNGRRRAAANVADHPVSDLQDWPPWPPLVVATATELARYTRQHLIAAQTALARITQAPTGRDDPRRRVRVRITTLAACGGQPRERRGRSSCYVRSPQITLSGVMPGWCAERPRAARSFDAEAAVRQQV